MAARLHFRCAKRTVTVDDGEQTVLDAAIVNGIAVWHECGGNARCTTCRVRVVDGIGNVAPRTPEEERLASLRGWDPSTRLACQMRVTGDATVERLVLSGSDISPLQVETVLAGNADERRLAILCCDVRNFTRFVEIPEIGSPSPLSPVDQLDHLNRLFAALGEPILLNNGVIYQYVGGEITGLFGIEGGEAEAVCRASMRAGLGMMSALAGLNDSLEKDFGVRLEVGIGVHYGPVIIGRLGHPGLQRFGVIGDTVDAASRIQTMNKELDTTFLASQPIVDGLGSEALLLGKTAPTVLGGRQQPLALFEVKGFAEADPALVAQNTIGKLLAEDSGLTEIFYDRLFAEAPQVRAMFSDDISAQARKLSQMIEVICYALVRPEQLALGLHSLGKGHMAYGVERQHYALVRGPLLGAISDVLGADYDAETQAAWEFLVDMVLEVMQQGVTDVAAERFPPNR